MEHLDPEIELGAMIVAVLQPDPEMGGTECG
jgi:hypothetical protein